MEHPPALPPDIAERLAELAALALAPDAPREAFADFLAYLADALPHPRMITIAARERKPLGGRHKLDRAAAARKVGWLLDEGKAKTARAAARLVAREIGVPIHGEDTEARALALAYRKLSRMRKDEHQPVKLLGNL